MYVVDIETHDPRIKNYGAGAIRGDGEVLGVGLYNGEGEAEYLSTKNAAGMQKVENILSSGEDLCFHNGVYDLDWLGNGMKLCAKGRCEDTMTREYLLNAYAPSYSLDNCCTRAGITGKNKGESIDIWWAAHKPAGAKGDAISNLHLIPDEVVGKYCKQDVIATYDLYQHQQPLLEEQNLLQANDIECRLYPVITEMKKNGIPVDWAKRNILAEKVAQEVDAGMADLQSKYPWLDSLGSAKQLEKIWEKEGIPIVRTEKGNPSFNADVLDDCTHPVAQQIKHIRTLETARSKFIDGSIADYYLNGRIHPTFYPALRDEGGTITGRFSCRNPNLQNMPARGDKLGSEIRSVFIPEPGCMLGAWDYKQIEYTVFCHYAQGPGAEEARAAIAAGVDYHQMTMDMMGWEGKEGRHIAKNLNFGSIYGLGWRGFAKKFKQGIIHQATALGMTCEEFAKDKMEEYFHKVTFVKPTCKGIEHTVTQRGYVKTVSGRRQRMPLDRAVYKVVNYLVQGTASDILKAGLVAGYEAGIFDVLKLHGTVHDENVFSIPMTREGVQAAEEFAYIMANATKLKVPIRVDQEVGFHWGNCNSDEWSKLKKQYL